MVKEKDLESISIALNRMKTSDFALKHKNKYICSIGELTEYEEFLMTDLYVWLISIDNLLHMIAPSFISSGICRFILNGNLVTVSTGDVFDVEEYILPFKYLYIDIDDYEELEWGNYAYDVNKKRVINLWTGKPCVIVDEE